MLINILMCGLLLYLGHVSDRNDDVDEENKTEAIVKEEEEEEGEVEQSPGDESFQESPPVEHRSQRPINRNLNISAAKNIRVECGLCGVKLTLSALRFHRQFHPKSLYMVGCTSFEYPLLYCGYWVLIAVGNL